MKTGEEKFDDEIRQKLRYSEVTPPDGLFNKIVPPSNKKRGFFWIWLAGIVLLGITIGVMQFYSGDYAFNDKPFQRIQPAERINANEQVSSSQSNAEINTATQTPIEVIPSPVEQKNIQNQLNTTKGSSGKKYNIEFSVSSKTLHADQANNTKKRKQEHSSVVTTESHLSDQQMTYNNRQNTSGNTYNYDLLYVPMPALPYSERTIVNQQLKIIKPANTEFKSHTSTPFAIEVAASYVNFYSKTNPDTKDTLASRMYAERDQLNDKMNGFAVSAKVLYSLNNRFTLRAGIGYSKRTEEFAFDFKEYFQVTEIDSIIYYILFPFLPSTQVVKFDTTISTLSESHPISHKITFQTVSVGAGIGYSIPLGAFVIEPQVGIAADIFTSSSGNTNFNPEFTMEDGADYYEKQIQFGLQGTLQLSYSLSEKINVFAATGYQFGINEFQPASGFYTENLNHFSLGAGVKYIIFKKQAAKVSPSGSDITTN